MYLLTLAIGLVVVWPVRTVLLQYGGSSIALDSLVERTRYSFLNDFWVAYGDGWLPDPGQLMLLGGLFLLWWTFLTGGLIQCLRLSPDKKNFWAACGAFFRPLLTINVGFILMHATLIVLFFFIYRAVSSGFSPARLDTETIIFTSIPWVWGSYLILASWVLMWQSLSQVALVRDRKDTWFRAIRAGFGLFRQRFGSYVLFGLLSIGILAVCYVSYHALKQAIPMGERKGALGLLFLLTQCWLWIRICGKLCFLAILLRLSKQEAPKQT